MLRRTRDRLATLPHSLGAVALTPNASTATARAGYLHALALAPPKRINVFDSANNLVTQLFGGTSQTPMRVDLTYNPDNQIASLTRYSNLAGTTNVAFTSFAYDATCRLAPHRDARRAGRPDAVPH
jgi:hypothetical protein